MTHKTTKRFQNLLHDLPPQVQSTAKEKFKLLKENPGHPSLHFKKVGKFWSVRINDNYRALAVRKEDTLIWIWIGNHKDYEKLINR